MNATDLIHYWFESLWNQGREETIDECMAPNMVAYGLGEDIVGREQFHSFYRTFKAAFPTSRIIVERVLESGSYATCLARAELVTADGRGPFHMIGSTTVRIEDGRMVEGWNYFDFLSLLTQMGIVPTDAMSTALLGAPMLEG